MLSFYLIQYILILNFVIITNGEALRFWILNNFGEIQIVAAVTANREVAKQYRENPEVQKEAIKKFWTT
jgi:hypothetical protein